MASGIHFDESLRSVSEVIRRCTPSVSVESKCAESLLILGLEGSREECSTLWVFKVGIEPVGVKEAKEVGGSGFSFMLAAGNKATSDESGLRKHTKCSRAEVRQGLEMFVRENHAE
jgi:hypothetical protein